MPEMISLRMRGLAVWCVALGLVVVWPTAAAAKHATPESAKKLDITAKSARDGYVKVDGFVTDWEGVPATTSEALTRGEWEYDWTGPKDLSIKIQAQYDSQHLYLAVEVFDNVVSGPQRRDRGDRVEIWIDGGPVAADGPHGRLKMLELALGDMESDGKPSVTWQYPKALKGKEPEGLLKDGSMRVKGYFFEVGLPLAQASEPAPGLEPLGIAVIARDLDRDDPREDEAAVATAPFDGRKARDVATMARLRLAGAESMAEGFFRQVPDARGVKLTAEHMVDVGGDSRRERVFLVKNYLVIVGYGLGDGDYYYYNLPTASHITHHSLEVEDLTGDGRAEMIVRYKLRQGPVTQEVGIIFHFALDRLLLVWHHELVNDGPGWSVRNELVIKKGRRGQPSTLTVKPSKESKPPSKEAYLDVDGDMIVDWERILLPWGERSQNVFKWEAGQFLRQSR